MPTTWLLLIRAHLAIVLLIAHTIPSRPVPKLVAVTTSEVAASPFDPCCGFLK